MTIRHARPFEFGQFRAPFSRTHVRPDNSTVFGAGVRCRLHLVLKRVFGRLIRHVHAGTVHVKLPSVINASKAAFFVATPEQAGAPVWTEFVDESDAAVRVAKRNE